MRIALIVAMARNRVIGSDNRLPWHLPADMKRFRLLTLGKPVIMGRRTFESIGKALPGRTNIVLTRRDDFRPPDMVQVVPGLDSALQLAREIAARDGVDECMVIGGGELYAASLPIATRIYLTLIDADVPGDTLFPEIHSPEWIERSREDGGLDPDTGLKYSYLVLERNVTPDVANGG
jgi:dihydrofolate reductase